MNPKLISGLLAGGILVLGGGSALVATLPSPSSSSAVSGLAAVHTASVAAGQHSAPRPAVPSSPTVTTGIAPTEPSPTGTSPSALAAGAAPASGQATPTPSTAYVSSNITYAVKPGDTIAAIAHYFDSQGFGAQYAANVGVIDSHMNLVVPGEVISITNGVLTIHAPI